MKAGVAHVQRHGGTKRALADVLERKVRRALGDVAREADRESERQRDAEQTPQFDAPDDGEREAALEEALGWVGEVVAALEAQGSLNDRLYAELLARSLHGSGKSRRVIQGRLAQKGVPRELIDQAIDQLEDESEDVDGDAAREFARKRRLGPYRRPDVELDEPRRRKELGAFARAGFTFDLARRMVEADPEEP